MTEFPPIIAPEALLQEKDSGFILIDARSGAAGRSAYGESRLAGALHVDLDTDLADVPADPANGGRHPLPSPAQFAAVLGRLGITPESRVVVYDDKAGANAAARFWWMLRAAGHAKIQVIDGGLQAATAAGYPVETGAPVAAVPAPGPYPFEKWVLPMAGLADIETLVRDTSARVIDVRDAVRYRGEKEPIDRIAGHIPGAINMPFSGNLQENGRFKSPEELRARYQELVNEGDRCAVHCGSGVTACHTLLAMAHAGLPLPRLYVGSWSEWSNAGRPVATGD